MYGVRLRLAYDGSELAGWQRQPGQRTAQGELEAALTAITGEPIAVRGASRTDSGVHAEDQVAAFDCARELPMKGWTRVLNAKLPQDLVVRSAEPCPVGYNPRYDAKGKVYRYLLHLGRVRDPQWRRMVWHLGPRRARPWRGVAPQRAADWLDLEAMAAAARAFEGEHDFHAFRASRDLRENTVRTLTRVAIEPAFCGREDLVAIEVRGTAFLQHMVRILVGTLVEVGRERRTLESLAALLDPSATRERAGETAPASGLTLVQVELGRERPDRSELAG